MYKRFPVFFSYIWEIKVSLLLLVRYQLYKSGVYGRAYMATEYVVKFSLDIIVIGKCKALVPLP